MIVQQSNNHAAPLDSPRGRPLRHDGHRPGAGGCRSADGRRRRPDRRRRGAARRARAGAGRVPGPGPFLADGRCLFGGDRGVPVVVLRRGARDRGRGRHGGRDRSGGRRDRWAGVARRRDATRAAAGPSPRGSRSPAWCCSPSRRRPALASRPSGSRSDSRRPPGYASYAVLSKRLLRLGHSPTGVMGSSFGFAGVLLLPVLALAGTSWLAEPRAIGLVVYLAVARRRSPTCSTRTGCAG